MTEPKHILVSWYTNPAYIPPFRLSSRQYTTGPQLDGTVPPFDAITPRGAYDLKAVVEQQGGPGKVDLVVVWTDASRVNMPMNVKAFGCPTVLCVGDTHHMDAPLQGMLSYARQAGFDFVVSSHNRHHLHWFVEHGMPQVAWIPALKVQHIPRPFERARTPRLAFVGQFGRFHPRRRRLVEGIQERRLPLIASGGTREFAADLYASSGLSLNISLNGDLNLRVFEVLSAGGCLMTDRLATESGIDVILEPEREYLSYGDLDELLDKSRFYLSRPEAALAVAEAGMKAYAERLSPEQQIRSLLDWVFTGRLDAAYRPDWDRRPAFNAAEPLVMGKRVQLYERIQEVHRTTERCRVLFSPHVDAGHIADALDLQRLHPAILSDGSGRAEATRRRLSMLGLGHPVEILSTNHAQAQNWDVAIQTAAIPLPRPLATKLMLTI